ncbi:MAG TPA: glycosyltransferase family 4 protein [Candidatus Thermoplasmatota archaeon]|nr:glycosyltransferase family 4 protein [Candidatus Thermoplasmatota archaeon]
MTAPEPDRVCIVTQALYPDILGGAPIGAHELANLLARRGVEVEVHTVDYRRPPESSEAVEVLYHLERHRFPRLPWDRIGTAGNPFAWRIGKAVRRSAAPVVHLRSHLFFTSLFGMMGARRSGKATVLSVHGVRAVRSRFVNLLQETWLRTVARHLFRRADRVVCLTTPDRDEVLRYGARPERTVTLFNSYNERLFHPGPAQAPTVLWVGRHVEEKGIRHLLDAWATVQSKAPEAELVLVGDGPLKADAQRQAKALGLRSVRFLPFTAQAEVASLLRGCLLFVLPSLKEGFPISLVEAMACGKPVVTTTGLEEIVGDAGVTVPPRDPPALANAILGYLQDDARTARAGNAAARRARERYSLAKLADAYLAVYREAMAQRQASAKRA